MIINRDQEIHHPLRFAIAQTCMLGFFRASQIFPSSLEFHEVKYPNTTVK